MSQMPVPAVLTIDGVVRDYAWGSRTAIAALLGLEPDGSPAAELWFGAHPASPSPVQGRGAGLDQVIAADPDGLLGPAVVAEFGPRLPFLLKVLAADKALSIQVHPTLEQARAGFAAENRAGLTPDDPARNYRDDNHKPELLCALTPFTALCGFRSPEQTVELIDELPAQVGAALAEVRAELAGPDPTEALRAAFTRLLTLGPDERDELVEQVVAGCRSVLTRYAPLDTWADGSVGAARVVDLCAQDYPGDVGAVLSLLLNPLVLQPGEAIYLAPGNVHSYLRGTGIELMASSDNVLRCGLTDKHVDVPELLTITDFSSLSEPRWPADQEEAGAGFTVPAPEFSLHTVDLSTHGPVRLHPAGPAIVLCVGGASQITAGSVRLELPMGRAAFVPPSLDGFELEWIGPDGFGLDGTGHVFVAGVGGPLR